MNKMEIRTIEQDSVHGDRWHVSFSRTGGFVWFHTVTASSEDEARRVFERALGEAEQEILPSLGLMESN